MLVYPGATDSRRRIAHSFSQCNLLENGLYAEAGARGGSVYSRDFDHEFSSLYPSVYPMKKSRSHIQFSIVQPSEPAEEALYAVVSAPLNATFCCDADREADAHAGCCGHGAAGQHGDCCTAAGTARHIHRSASSSTALSSLSGGSSPQLRACSDAYTAPPPQPAARAPHPHPPPPASARAAPAPSTHAPTLRNRGSSSSLCSGADGRGSGSSHGLTGAFGILTSDQWDSLQSALAGCGPVLTCASAEAVVAAAAAHRSRLAEAGFPEPACAAGSASASALPSASLAASAINSGASGLSFAPAAAAASGPRGGGGAAALGSASLRSGGSTAPGRTSYAGSGTSSIASVWAAINAGHAADAADAAADAAAAVYDSGDDTAQGWQQEAASRVPTGSSNRLGSGANGRGSLPRLPSLSLSTAFDGGAGSPERRLERQPSGLPHHQGNHHQATTQHQGHHEHHHNGHNGQNQLELQPPTANPLNQMQQLSFRQPHPAPYASGGGNGNGGGSGAGSEPSPRGARVPSPSASAVSSGAGVGLAHSGAQPHPHPQPHPHQPQHSHRAQTLLASFHGQAPECDAARASHVTGGGGRSSGRSGSGSGDPPSPLDSGSRRRQPLGVNDGPDGQHPPPLHPPQQPPPPPAQQPPRARAHFKDFQFEQQQQRQVPGGAPPPSLAAPPPSLQQHHHHHPIKCASYTTYGYRRARSSLAALEQGGHPPASEVAVETSTDDDDTEEATRRITAAFRTHTGMVRSSGWGLLGIDSAPTTPTGRDASGQRDPWVGGAAGAGGGVEAALREALHSGEGSKDQRQGDSGDDSGGLTRKRSSYHLTNSHAAVELFLRLNHARQTMDFVKRQTQLFGSLDRAVMSVWEALGTMDELREYEAVLMAEGGEAQEVAALSLLDHAFQTAELCRLHHPDLDWLHLVGLVHGLGKLLAHRRFGSQPQWAICGETYPLGCRFSPHILGAQYFTANPDRRRRLYNTATGIYAPGAGLLNVVMSWSAPEYLYLVMVMNGAPLPQDALWLLRHAKFASLPRPGSCYTPLCSPEDVRRLPLLRSFQSLAAFRRAELPEGFALQGERRTAYYSGLIEKYIGAGALHW